MNEDPNIVFRNGPAGPRPAVEDGPDVWEVIRVVRNAPATGKGSIGAAAEWLGLSQREVEVAFRYYQHHRDEVDTWIDRLDREAAEAEMAWRRGRE